MILIDTNIIMYAAGAAHPNKGPSVRLLDRVARGDVEAAIDSECLQEILHRYRSINRWKDGRDVYDLTRQMFPAVVVVSAEILDRARQLLDDYSGFMARDAVHAAVVQHEQMDAICSYDKDFDKIGGVRRMEPDAVALQA
ncbi:MAG: type II toxin-antitoxin system VapC family toxin [Gemmatimonas sp.]